MFGYKLIKKSEIENLKLRLEDALDTIILREREIVELESKIKEQENTIAKLSNSTKDKQETTTEEKHVKKVRRKSSKKTTKKEE